MFFVTGSKVYLGVFDESIKAFPEVELYRDETDQVRYKPMSKGVSRKPANRQICTWREVVAQFGAGASQLTEAPQPEQPEQPEAEPPKGKSEK